MLKMQENKNLTIKSNVTQKVPDALIHNKEVKKYKNSMAKCLTKFRGDRMNREWLFHIEGGYKSFNFAS